MNKLVTLMFLVGLSFNAFADADKIADIRKSVQSCMNDNASNMGLKMCASDGLEQATTLLDETMKKILSNPEMEKEVKDRWQHSQKSWNRFMQDDCVLQGASMLGGTGEGLVILSCEMEMTLDRVKAITSDNYYF